MHAHAGHGVVRAACGVDVVVSAPPAEQGGIDPAPDLKLQRGACACDFDMTLLRHGLGATAEGDVVSAIRQLQHFAIAAIDLRVEKEVRRMALDLAGVDAPGLVLDKQLGHAGFAIFIGDGERDLACGAAVEEHAGLIAKAEILRALPGVETENGLAFSRLAGVELDDAVLHAQPAERGLQRRGLKHLHVQPARGDGRLAGIARFDVRSHRRRAFDIDLL